MSHQDLAVLPLTATGVVLLHRRDPLTGAGRLAIPRGRAADVGELVREALGLDATAETMGTVEDRGDVSLFRVRLPARSRPQAPADADVVVLDFTSFETAVDGGRITDAVTLTAWLRHRLLQGERTRRRLPPPFAWTSGHLQALEEMRAEARYPAEIARELGTTRDIVTGQLHRLGLPTKAAGARRRTAKAGPAEVIVARFATACDRQPVVARSGDAAMMVALAALETDRDPALTSVLSGVDRRRTDQILHRFAEEGIWKPGDPAPVRWKSPGHALAMLVDAQVAYGIFRGQVLA
jgi:hypothetical protein